MFWVAAGGSPKEADERWPTAAVAAPESLGYNGGEVPAMFPVPAGCWPSVFPPVDRPANLVAVAGLSPEDVDISLPRSLPWGELGLIIVGA